MGGASEVENGSLGSLQLAADNADVNDRTLAATPMYITKQLNEVVNNITDIVNNAIVSYGNKFKKWTSTFTVTTAASSQVQLRHNLGLTPFQMSQAIVLLHAYNSRYIYKLYSSYNGGNYLTETRYWLDSNLIGIEGGIVAPYVFMVWTGPTSMVGCTASNFQYLCTILIPMD